MKLEIRLELKSSSVNPNKQVQCQFVLMETDCRSAINEQSSSPTKEVFSWQVNRIALRFLFLKY